MRTAACALLLLSGALPAAAQPPARPEQAAAYFDRNYAQVRAIYAGWRYTAQFRRELDGAHRSIVLALRRRDETAFRAGLARFIDLSKGEILRRANIMDGTTHGGGTGSSENFSRGYNNGVAIGGALIRRYADRNEITCMYLFAERPMSAGESLRRVFSGEQSVWDNEPFRTCNMTRLARLRASIARGRLTISGLRAMLAP